MVGMAAWLQFVRFCLNARLVRALLLICFFSAMIAQSMPVAASMAISAEGEMPFDDQDTEKPYEKEEAASKVESHVAAPHLHVHLHRGHCVPHHVGPVGDLAFTGRDFVNAIHRLRI
jgi:hypothetical protein